MEFFMKLSSKQDIIVTLLCALNRPLSNTDFMKYLFLFSEFQTKPSFDFVPYRYGCFSFEAYREKDKLVELGIIKENPLIEVSSDYNKGGSCFSDFSNRTALWKLTKKYSSLTGKDLVRCVYLEYPYYAINSEIAEKILTEEEYATVLTFKPINTVTGVFSLGYEGLSLEKYLNLLIKSDVKLVLDVRKNPISRKYGFSQRTLASALKSVDISYIHMPELGIDSSMRTELNAQADYDKLFSAYERDVLPHQDEYIHKIYDLLGSKKRIALTCFEKDPAQCHRTRVIARLKQLHPDLKGGKIWDLKESLSR